MNGKSLTGWGVGGGCRSVGTETPVNKELAEVGEFLECDRGEFGKEVLG